MKAHLTRRYWFSASHRLHSEEMSEAENQAIYGKCNNPYGHGHNYALEVTVSGPVNPSTGMVCNIVLCREVFGRLEEGFRMPGVRVEKVRLEETLMNSFEYAGGRELRV